MTRALQIGHLLLLLAGIAFLVILGWRAWTLADSLDAVFVSANGVLDSVQATVVNVNRPCKGSAGPNACGVLAQVNKTSIAIGDIANDSNRQVAKSGAVLLQTQKTLQGIADDVHSEIGSVQDTTNAATETLHSASDDLKTLNTSIAATKPLIDRTDEAMGHVATLASDPNFTLIPANVQRMTTDGARITKDAADEADKLAHPAKKKLGFWGGLWVGLTYVHKLMPPIF